MKKYLLLVVAVVFAAGFAFAGSYGQSEATNQNSTGSSIPWVAMSSPSSAEKTYEGNIESLMGSNGKNSNHPRIEVKDPSARGKLETFIVEQSTVIEAKDHSAIAFSDLKKNEKVMVTYEIRNNQNVAVSITVES
jgi:hypothetical protein